MKDKAALWREAFETDVNAIVPALTDYAWNYAAYLSVKRAVDIAEVNAAGEKKLNFMILDLLDSSYWAGAILAIRRLVDKGPLKGAKGVISLRSILQDVQNQQDNLTRRVYIEDISGLEYDVEEIERKHRNFILAKKQGTGIWTPRELDSFPTRIRHEQFDFLSGISSNNRSDDDKIKTEVFESLEKRLNHLDRIADQANLYIAHAATRRSREGREISEWGVQEAKESLKLLTETAELIGRWFVGTGVGDVLPVPQYDQFKYASNPLVKKKDIPELELQWEEFEKEAMNWCRIEDTAL